MRLRLSGWCTPARFELRLPRRPGFFKDHSSPGRRFFRGFAAFNRDDETFDRLRGGQRIRREHLDQRGPFTCGLPRDGVP